MSTMMLSDTNVAARQYSLAAAELGLAEVMAALDPAQVSNVQTAKKKGHVLICATLDSGTGTLTAKAETDDVLDFASGTIGVDKLVLALSTTPNWGLLPVDAGSASTSGSDFVETLGKKYWGIKIEEGGAGLNIKDLVVLELAAFDPNANGSNYHNCSAAFNAVPKYGDGSLDTLKGI